MQSFSGVGIDQYGDKYYFRKYPRKELLEQLHRKHASKMYVDGPDNQCFHVGYVIACRWISVYKSVRIPD